MFIVLFAVTILVGFGLLVVDWRFDFGALWVWCFALLMLWSVVVY